MGTRGKTQEMFAKLQVQGRSSNIYFLLEFLISFFFKSPLISLSASTYLPIGKNCDKTHRKDSSMSQLMFFVALKILVQPALVLPLALTAFNLPATPLAKLNCFISIKRYS